jgi:hypothetical protein
MEQDNFNPVIVAVQNLRRMASEIKSENTKILEQDGGIIKNIEEAGKMLINDETARNEWVKLKTELMLNVNELRGIMTNLENKFKNNDVTGLTDIWKIHVQYKDHVHKNLLQMQSLGNVIFMDEKLEKWNKLFAEIFEHEANILDVAKSYELKLRLMESLKPEEINELNMAILKHIPWDYTDDEASKYEKEYLQAYNELKEEQSKKKNLWDKIMDVLAGGAQETPAHRVQMRRWLEAEEK